MLTERVRSSRQDGAMDYVINPVETTVSFEVKQLGFAHRGGEFRSVAGVVVVDATKNSGSIHIVVDTRSVRAGSAIEETFLRGPSVLDVERHSEIAYRAEHIVFMEGKPARIDGELTLRGVTRPMSLTVRDYTCAAKCVLDATAVFKRSEFGMTRYMAIIGDDVKLSIHGVTRDEGN
jgi:polyisoprenoid-binding protein YceI